MSKIILQPAAGKEARIHYADTIESAVPLKTIEKFVDSKTMAILKKIYPQKKAFVWGITPSNDTSDTNKSRWQRIEKGDKVLFYREGVVIASATVTHCLHNKRLAKALWNTMPDGRIWEYIYFVDEVTPESIPCSLVKKILRYKESSMQRVTVLYAEQSEELLEALEMQWSDTYVPSFSEAEYVNTIEKMKGKALSKRQTVNTRLEQGQLRQYLFAGHNHKACGICGKRYPVSFLIAAHVKKHAKCTEKEKLDYKHIVMPMCTFGCDSLYEKGWITVIDGSVAISHVPHTTKDCRAYMLRIQGRKVGHWNRHSKKYFDWHHKNTFLGKKKAAKPTNT